MRVPVWLLLQGICRGMERGAVRRWQCLLQMAALRVCGVGGLLVSPRQLLQHECPRCPELPPFSLFGDLEQHMRKQHELFCCKLCLKHLKVRPTLTVPIWGSQGHREGPRQR